MSNEVRNDDERAFDGLPPRPKRQDPWVLAVLAVAFGIKSTIGYTEAAEAFMDALEAKVKTLKALADTNFAERNKWEALCDEAIASLQELQKRQ